jgi:hypothetical protein
VDCHIWNRNCVLKQVIEGNVQRKLEVAERRGRRRKQLRDYLKEKKGYWKLKRAALGRCLWQTHLGGSYGLVRQNTELEVG